MKKHLLLFLFLCAAAAGNTQSLVLRIDSVYITNINNGISNQLYAAEEATQDSACRTQILTSLYYNYFNNTNTKMFSMRTIYTYYPDNSVYQLLTQSGDTAEQTFTNNTRTTYLYDGWLLDTIQFANWADNKWTPRELTVFDYTSAGDETLELHQNWNSQLNAYVNYSQNLFDYDENGNQIYVAIQRWDSTTSQWFSDYEFSSTYDGNNFKVSEVDKFYDYFKHNLNLTRTITYYNNSKGYPDSSYAVNSNDQSYRRSYYTYYPDLIQRHYRYDYDFTAKGDSLSSDVETHYLDSSGYKYSDSTTVAFRSPGDAPGYRVMFTNFRLTGRNADSTLRTLTTGDIIYNDDGTVSYNFISRTPSYYEPCQPVLPVTLLSFTADKKDNNAILQWKTSNETNTASFAVQRSTDGVHFTTISSVKAAGNSNGERSYTYTDFSINSLGVNKIYYRLAQQDINGSVHNSAIAEIEIINGKLSITLSPNPVRNSIGIYSPVAIQNAVIRIADMSGKVVYTSCMNLIAGTKVSVDASAFAKGVYFVTVQTNTAVHVAKLVKE